MIDRRGRLDGLVGRERPDVKIEGPEKILHAPNYVRVFHGEYLVMGWKAANRERG